MVLTWLNKSLLKQGKHNRFLKIFVTFFIKCVLFLFGLLKISFTISRKDGTNIKIIEIFFCNSNLHKG